MPAAKEWQSVRLDPGQRERLRQLADETGDDVSSLLRSAAELGLRELGAAPIECAVAPWRWRLKDFKAFAEGLELPDGSPFRLEGHLLLVLREVFTDGRVELLVLLPKGNYKTTLFAALAVFHLLTVKNAQCYIGASDKTQADEMYRFAAHFAESDDRIAGMALVRRSTREVRSEVDRGFIRVLASDDSRLGGKRQGFNPTLALIDELQAHENENLYADMRSGVFKRRGLIVTITTAGSDEESVLGRLRAGFLEQPNTRRGLKVSARGQAIDGRGNGRLTIARTPTGNGVMLEWACTDADDLDDPEQVKLANPASGVTLASIEDAREAPGITAAMFARLRANVWAQADDAVIDEAVWDALNTGAQVPAVADVWVTVDYARKSDSAAVVQLWQRDDGKVVPQAHVWARAVKAAGRTQPACHTLIRDETIIRQSRIRDHIRDIRDNGRNVLGVVYDPHLFDPEELSDEGFAMVEHPQTHSRMCPASKALYEAVNAGELEHDGDPVLRSHVIHAGAKAAGEEWRFSKAASKKPIDALICLVMGIKLALTPPVAGGFEW